MKPWLYTMIGKGRLACATGTSRFSDCGRPGSAGYQTSVTSVRLGAPGNVPFAIVGRLESTNIKVVTPTPAEPGCNTMALVRGASGGVPELPSPSPPQPATSAMKTLPAMIALHLHIVCERS